MGFRGRVPLTKAELEARGGFRADRHAGRASRVPGAVRPGTPKPPPFLSAPAKAEFRRVAKELAAVLCPSDVAVLTVYAEAYAELGELAGLANGATSPAQVRLARMRTLAGQRCLAAADRIGASPAARARLRIEVARPPADDGGKGRFFRIH